MIDANSHKCRDFVYFCTPWFNPLKYSTAAQYTHSVLEGRGECAAKKTGPPCSGPGDPAGVPALPYRGSKYSLLS